MRLLVPVLLSFVALFGLPVASAQAQQQHIYTFEFEIRTSSGADPDQFSIEARRALNSAAGWSLTRHAIFRVSGRNPDFTLVLASPDVVASAAPVCSRRWSCRVGNRVYINEQRWLNSTQSWPGNLRTYRWYVVNHEVGHWLGLGHWSCPGRNQVAPVMQQQSISLDGCRANVEPLLSERRRVARLQGIAWNPDRQYYLAGFIGNPRNLRWRERDGDLRYPSSDQLWPELARHSREARASGQWRVVGLRGGVLYYVNGQGNFERIG